MGERFSGSNISAGGTWVTSGDFLIEVAKGNIPGHSLVFKYGRNPDIDTLTDPEEVWTYGGTYTYNDTPSIQYISSDNALDVGMEITVEGLDANYREQSITVVLNGQTQTQVGTGETFVRVFRAYNSGPLEFAGNVLIYDDTVTSVTLGVPTPASSIKAEITALDQQTYMALWTVPAGKTGFFMGGSVSITVGAAASKSAVVELRFRLPGGVFRSGELVGISSSGSSQFSQDLRALGPLQFPEKTDIQARVRSTSANDTGVSAYFSVLVVDNAYLN